MEKQPAKKNYFFEKGYKDVGKAFKKTWPNAFQPVANEAARVKTLFSINFIAAIFTLLCDIVVFSIFTVLVIAANLLFTVLFFCFVLFVGIFVYLGCGFLFVIDRIFCLLKHISSHCPNCQAKFVLPTYKCKKCFRRHTALRPSKYGVLIRKCTCGEKLPTTFFNGRQKMQAVCPTCGTDIRDGGRHMEIMIPVVGGASAGKTCFITMAISQLGKVASQHRLIFNDSPLSNNVGYESDKKAMENGKNPGKTQEWRMNYYSFYLTREGEKVKNLISLCDVSGEAYGRLKELAKQKGYKNSNAFLILVDPLTIAKFRNEVSGKIDVLKYTADYAINDARFKIDAILSALIKTVEDMLCLTSKDTIKTDVAVVFTKCDIPGLEDKIGETAVRRYQQLNYVNDKYQAQNAVCEQFLIDYEEDNFLNALKSKFKSVQFFACSALGHVENGTKFTPIGVEEPVLWLVDKVSKSIDLKNKWGKRI